MQGLYTIMSSEWIRALGMGAFALIMGLFIVEGGSPTVIRTPKYARSVKKLTKRNKDLAKSVQLAEQEIINNPMSAGTYKKPKNPAAPVAEARGRVEAELGGDCTPYEKKLRGQQWAINYCIAEGGTIVFYFFGNHKDAYGGGGGRRF